WTLTSSNGQTATVTGTAAATVNFANQAIAAVAGDLVINKTTAGGNGTFTFSVTGPNSYASTLTITTVSGTGTTKISGLQTGTYTVTESAQTGWTLTSSNGRTAAVTVAGIATLGFANKAIGDLTINKTAT